MTEDPSIEPAYLGLGLVGELFVDGLSQGAAQCASVQGNPNLGPGQRAIGSFGFDSSVDPGAGGLALTMADATVEFGTAP